MQIVRRTLTALAFLAAGGTASLAQEPAAPATAAAPAAAANSVRIPAGTVVQVELTEALSSQTSQQEQLFGLRLVEPIVLNGQTVVAAGATGGGEVIDAHPSAFGGRPGRLIVSGRFIEIGGQRVRIRGMQMMAAGSDRGSTAIAIGATGLVGMVGYLVEGGGVVLPVGARATAIIAADLEIPIEPNVVAIAEPAAPVVEQPAAGDNQ